MSNKKFLFQKKEFDGWKTLNDTVMGGSSSAFCEISNSGLILRAILSRKQEDLLVVDRLYINLL